MAVDVKRVIQELVVPDLQQIKSDVATIKVEIRRLDEKIDGLDRRLTEKIDGLDKRLNDKIDSLHIALSTRLDSVERGLTTAIDIHERLAALEAKLGH